MMTPFRTDSLLFGSLLAYAMQNPRFVDLCRAWIGLLYAALGILAVGIPVMMVRREWFEPFDFTWLSTFYLMLILLVQVSPQGLLARLFRSKVLLWFGLMSYAIYMFHEAVLGLCQYLLLGSNSGGIHAPIDAAVTVLAFAVTCALAALSARFFEGPIRKFGHRWKY
jgi:peptidoglycan/LPS O-acetylase OafA/YrhL